MAKTKVVNGDTGANLDFEAKLWAAADALRNNMDAAEYKHVVLDLPARRHPAVRGASAREQKLNHEGHDDHEEHENI